MSIKGVVHFNIDCDLFVGKQSEYPTATAFLKDAFKEDAGDEVQEQNGWSEAETFEKLLPFVENNGYIVHRVGECPSDPDLDDWWEFVDRPGRGHIKVWTLDIEKVEKALEQISSNQR